ncbi:MAG TPA: MOSC N-terminal beta barrel domain-containing protein [Gaiellaceae bacterium]|nr:MOSC N-terminal beta barrel domain-containing protein [Gaiellaceae bacterium]
MLRCLRRRRRARPGTGGRRGRAPGGTIPAVARISTTPVKSLALSHPGRIELTERGVAEDRRFYLLDADDRLVGGVKHGPLVRVRPDWDGVRLRLDFPGGQTVEAEVGLGERVETDFWRLRTVHGRRVVGPWAEALTDYAGAPLSLVRVDGASFAQDINVTTLVCDGSLAALGGLDGRRFRMLLELEGCAAFEEDGWDGGLVQAGGALLRIAGPVPRCAVTTQDTGDRPPRPRHPEGNPGAPRPGRKRQAEHGDVRRGRRARPGRRRRSGQPGFLATKTKSSSPAYGRRSNQP